MKIIQEHSKCIGCGSCVAVCSKYFEMDKNNLAIIIGGAMKGENMELEINEETCAKEAADICPVQIISVQ